MNIFHNHRHRHQQEGVGHSALGLSSRVLVSPQYCAARAYYREVKRGLGLYEGCAGLGWAYRQRHNRCRPRRRYRWY
jgi:hypothetical protein